jgi:hypothetical protein
MNVSDNVNACDNELKCNNKICLRERTIIETGEFKAGVDENADVLSFQWILLKLYTHNFVRRSLALVFEKNYIAH